MAGTDFNAYLEEAEINYNNQRYKEAAGTFEYLINYCTKEGNLLDAVHFCYRAIDSWEKAREPWRAMKVWRNLGVFSLRVASKLASTSANTSEDPYTKVQLLEILQETLAYLQDGLERYEILEELFENYLLLSEEYDRDEKERILFLENALKYPEVLDDERVRDVELKLAELHFKLAEKYMKSEVVGKKELIKRELLIANNIFRKYGLNPRVV